MFAGDIYTEFFGLDVRPFTLLPDPDTLFWSDVHRAAFTVLEYGIATRSPITVLTGEVGVGKTTLLQHLLRGIPEDTTIGLISNAQGGRGELLRWVTSALAIEDAEARDYVDRYRKLQEFLIDEYASGRRVALVIDEAQNLSIEALEELRMMTNINSGRDELLQLILVGQPQLRDLILKPELQQFAQRVVAAYHLGALSGANALSYIQHRMQVAGGTGEEFDPAAVGEIVAQTRGIPRLINKLCEFCLVYAAINEEKQVLPETVLQVVEDGVFITGFVTKGEAAE